jgi:hypothetical protein
MTRTHFAEGQILLRELREGDTADSVLRRLSGSVDLISANLQLGCGGFVLCNLLRCGSGKSR